MSECFLVVGGEGFIGRNLVSSLSNKGDEVVTLDINGEPDIRISIKDRNKLLEINGKFDGIFHLAAKTSPPYFDIDLNGGFLTNVNGTLNVLEFAKRSGIRKVVLASSSAVYGNNSTKSYETSVPEYHSSMYAVTKVFDEYLARYYSFRSEIECVSLRYFNTYGSNENNKGIYSSQISKFINFALKEAPIEVYGNGSQSRDFIYIKDTVEATIKAYERGKAGESYNIGTGISTDFNTIASIVKEETGSKSEIVHVPNPLKSYQMFTQADMSKTEKQLNFKAKYDVRMGIRDILSKI